MDGVIEGAGAVHYNLLRQLFWKTKNEISVLFTSFMNSMEALQIGQELRGYQKKFPKKKKFYTWK